MLASESPQCDTRLMERGWAILLFAGCAHSVTAEGAADARRVDARPSADARQIADARPAADARLDASVCSTPPQQLLTNASFDAAGGWVQMPQDPAYPIISAPPQGATAPSAPKIAWFGGAVNSTELMSQDLTAPPGTKRLVFSGKVLVSGPLSIGAQDEMIISLRSQNDTLIAELGRWDNNDTSILLPEWEDYTTTVTVPATLALRLHLVALNDETEATSFLFDNLSLVAEVCP